MQELAAYNFHCGLPKLLACGDSIARLNQTFCDLLHFQGAPMTAIGPSRHFVAPQQFSRFRCRADITRLAADTTPVANGPIAEVGRIKIPQRSSPCRVLSFWDGSREGGAPTGSE